MPSQKHKYTYINHPHYRLSYEGLKDPTFLDVSVKWPSFGTSNRPEYPWPLESFKRNWFLPGLSLLAWGHLRWQRSLESVVTLMRTTVSPLQINTAEDFRTQRNVFTVKVQWPSCARRQRWLNMSCFYKAELLLPQLRAVGRARASGMKEREASRTPVSRRIQESACARWPPGNPRELARAALWRISLYI